MEQLKKKKKTLVKKNPRLVDIFVLAGNDHHWQVTFYEVCTGVKLNVTARDKYIIIF